MLRMKLNVLENGTKGDCKQTPGAGVALGLWKNDNMKELLD